jgi:hypothetical protein
MQNVFLKFRLVHETSGKIAALLVLKNCLEANVHEFVLLIENSRLSTPRACPSPITQATLPSSYRQLYSWNHCPLHHPPRSRVLGSESGGDTLSSSPGMGRPSNPCSPCRTGSTHPRSQSPCAFRRSCHRWHGYRSRRTCRNLRSPNRFGKSLPSTRHHRHRCSICCGKCIRGADSPP